MGNDWNALQSNRYTNFKNLYNSKNIDDLLEKDYSYYQNKQLESDEEFSKEHPDVSDKMIDDDFGYRNKKDD